MKNIVTLVSLVCLAGSAFASDAQKIVVARADVKAAVAKPQVRVAAPVSDTRYDNAKLESFSCCSLPQ